MFPADRPDFAKSRAILIGTSDYTHLPALPAAMNSLDAVADLLTGDLCGWPPDRVEVLRNVWDVNYLNRTLARLIRETSDVLIFYYVGHGQPTLHDDLCMGLVHTAADAAEREFSGLLMNTVRRMLAASRARVKVVVLDCCFSGIATEHRQSGDEDTYIAGLTRVYGAYTLTASEAHMPARYETGPTPFTQFTKNLTELVRAGIAGAPRQLTLDLIFPHLQERLRRQGLPEPTRMSIRDAGSFVFARNAAPDPASVDPEVELQQLRRAVAEAEARGYALQIEFEQRARELEFLRRELAEVGGRDDDTAPGLRAAVDEAAAAVTETTTAQVVAQSDLQQAVEAAEQATVPAGKRVVPLPAASRPAAPVAPGRRRFRRPPVAVAAVAALATASVGAALLMNGPAGDRPPRAAPAFAAPAGPKARGTEIVWSAGPSNTRNDVVLGESDHSGGPTRRLTPYTSGIANPTALSPDGTAVVYVRATPHEDRLYETLVEYPGNDLRFAPGSEAAEISVTARPAWSPDGKQLAVVGSGPRGTGLFIVDLRGRIVRRLRQAEDRQIGDPAWSGDGHIAYWYSDNPGALAGRIMVARADGTSAAAPIPAPPTPAYFETAPAWSPDSKMIAFRNAMNRSLRDGDSDIWVSRWTGEGWAAPEDLTANTPTTVEEDPAWSLDGRTIAFGRTVIGSDRQIWVMDAHGGSLRQLSPRCTKEPCWANAPTFGSPAA